MYLYPILAISSFVRLLVRKEFSAVRLLKFVQMVCVTIGDGDGIVSDHEYYLADIGMQIEWNYRQDQRCVHCTIGQDRI